MVLANMKMPCACCECPLNFWNQCNVLRFQARGGHIENPGERLPDCPLIDLGGVVPMEYVPEAKEAAIKSIMKWRGPGTLLYNVHKPEVDGNGFPLSEGERNSQYNQRVIPDYEKQIYQKAQSTCGDLTEVVVAMEEMAELIKELCKALRGKGNRDNIVEEMADVLIGTGQMLTLFDAEAETLVAKENKLKRLVQRLHDDGTA